MRGLIPPHNNLCLLNWLGSPSRSHPLVSSYEKIKHFIKLSITFSRMFNVIGTETFQKEIGKWPKDYQEIAEKIPRKLAENPLLGDPLGYPFLREKRVREKRVYYLVYPNLNLVLLVAASGKKDQQATINHIKEQLDEYRIVAEQIAKQVS